MSLKKKLKVFNELVELLDQIRIQCKNVCLSNYWIFLDYFYNES